MTERYRVLIADRNPRIRKFLEREFATAGYEVWLAESSQALFTRIYGPLPLDLLIIDPDLPDVDVESLSRKLRDRIPPLPVVIHTLDPEVNTFCFSLTPAELVEKNGGSVEDLKKTVAGILSTPGHPSRRLQPRGDPQKKMKAMEENGSRTCQHTGQKGCPNDRERERCHRKSKDE